MIFGVVGEGGGGGVGMGVMLGNGVLGCRVCNGVGVGFVFILLED